MEVLVKDYMQEIKHLQHLGVKIALETSQRIALSAEDAAEFLESHLNDSEASSIFYQGVEFSLSYDEFAENPLLNNDFVPSFLSFSTRYLTSESFKEVQGGYKALSDFEDEWEALSFFQKGDYVFLIIEKYEHSGIALIPHTGLNYMPNCRFDSNTFGILYYHKETLREMFQKERLSKKDILQAQNILKGFVKELEYFLNGECYMLQIDEDFINLLGLDSLEEVIKNETSRRNYHKIGA